MSVMATLSSRRVLCQDSTSTRSEQNAREPVPSGGDVGLVTALVPRTLQTASVVASGSDAGVTTRVRRATPCDLVDGADLFPRRRRAPVPLLPGRRTLHVLGEPRCSVGEAIRDGLEGDLVVCCNSGGGGWDSLT